MQNIVDSSSKRSYISKSLVDAIEDESIRTKYLAPRYAFTSEYLHRENVKVNLSDKNNQSF